MMRYKKSKIYALPLAVNKHLSALRVKILFWHWAKEQGYLKNEPGLDLYFNYSPSWYIRYLKTRINRIKKSYNV